jgi:hypothetical protein
MARAARIWTEVILVLSLITVLASRKGELSLQPASMSTGAYECDEDAVAFS